MKKSKKFIKEPKKELGWTERHFGVILEKVGRDEFALLEKRVAALKKSR